MSELVFEITPEEDGGFCVKAVGEGIFTQGDTWEELRANIKDAVEGYYFDGEKPDTVRLRLVRDEVLVAG
jgi:predicted RNase H-like HicB family nuclease